VELWLLRVHELAHGVVLSHESAILKWRVRDLVLTLVDVLILANGPWEPSLLSNPRRRHVRSHAQILLVLGSYHLLTKHARHMGVHLALSRHRVDTNVSLCGGIVAY